jgi:predicted GNAT superfamily acetyltransferase
MTNADIVVRECESFDDFKQCIDLERSVWKDDDIDIMPVRLYLISRACKAPTIGAFDRSGRLVGFAHTMLALRGRNLAFHSHMLAVLEEMRDRDIGYRIKLAQREFAIKAGVPLMFWTFDPLQSRNAHFNINKLGAVARSYEVNYYGQGVSTGFDRDVPSDRLIAEWWVTSPHVVSALAGVRPQVAAPTATVVIPDDIASLSASSPGMHQQWRIRVREDFMAALSGGAIVRGFERVPQEGQSRYLLGPDNDQFHFASER